ncbi:uncharacterized protein EDB93DRAFT_1256573 [Suillus bovinus]|uniref:uncharacterized protein n=1 Tax=Suillus bovinus TaxID=48563 RepID=UPI001B87B4F9|nr:uncharacterized protein EDB93DRAFT_1256573 [Suillus bovinus]KAG2128669.1 hypothetical protein EDB93DRAFT_1256573 [Suillus bovinus]
MPRPIIHKTPEAKLAAAREKRRSYYARDRILKNRRELRSSNSKESREARKFSRDLSKAVAKALRRDEDEDNLPECLRIVKEIKDEMLAKINDPCTFVHGILCAYVKNMPDNSSTKADISIIEMPMADIQKLLNRTTAAQDQILNFCGVLPEWHAADSVSRFLRTVLTYLEDIQFLVLYGGIPDLTLAHSMGELMYQKGTRI